MAVLLPQVAQISQVIKVLTSPGAMVFITLGFVGVIIIILWFLNQSYNKKIGWG
jgi:uncharacterized membrane protein YqjE